MCVLYRLQFDMKSCSSSRLPLQHHLANILFGYCSTPHSTTGHAPSALFLGQKLRTCLYFSKPNCKEHELYKLSKQAQSITNMPNLDALKLDSRLWPAIMDLVPSGCSQSPVWDRWLCWLRQITLRHGSDTMNSCTLPSWSLILPLTAVTMFWRLINHHTLLSLHRPQHHLLYPAIHKGLVNHLCVMAPHLVFDYPVFAY